jgi:uncharacterized protein (TIGR04562 family)
MNDALPPWLDIPWDTMETMIAGKSGIDVPRLHVRNLEDAREFIEGYGYDWENPAHRRELEALRAESIDFIETHLLFDEPHLTLPDAIRQQDDLRRLLLHASAGPSDPKQRWACNVLRVMHTFAHCGSYFQEQYEQQIRVQIGDRFRSHVHTDDSGQLWLGRGPESIPLAGFELRGRKSRTSLAMKLLQKAENVSADVFDWVGVRFITRERFDALMVARYLRVNNVIMFAHVKPGRSRNTLVDTDRVRHEMSELEDMLRAGRIARYEMLGELRRRVRNHPYPRPPVPSYNPYSSVAYHSIQFTCKQQIRIRNPHLHALGRVIENDNRTSLVTRVLDRMGVQTEVQFFFPYEVQILDGESWDRSRHGLASHREYKERQRWAVKRRLFGDTIAPRPPVSEPEFSEDEGPPTGSWSTPEEFLTR